MNWSILNVPKNSSKELVKKSYRKLALIHHPDKGGDPEKFRQVTDAYHEIMEGDDTKYDGLSDIVNLFSTFFYPEKKLENSEVELELTLSQIYIGGTFQFNFKRKIYGKTIFVSELKNWGPIYTKIKKPVESAPDVEKAIIKVYIAPGNTDDVLLKGKGDKRSESGHIQEAADIIVKLKILEHPSFKLIDKNLELTIDITLKEALTGLRKIIYHLDGEPFELICDDIIKPNYKFNMKNKGLTKYHDLYIICNVIFPTKLDVFQKQRLELIF